MRMSERRAPLVALIGGVALLLGAATGAPVFAQSQPMLPSPLPVPKTPATPAESGPATQAQPAPSTAAPSATPGGPRDPFDPLVKKPGPGEERRVQEIAGLKLVGLLWDVRSPAEIRALVETPDGLGYYLRLNDEKFGGKVVAIERDKVQFSVREQVPGGTARVRTVELKLAKTEGQSQ